MRHIATLTREEAARIRGVVFDIDDTLTRDGIIEAESYASLFALRDAGLHRVAVTGRPLGWCEVFANVWPVDLAVGENGMGYYARTQSGTREFFFHSEDERANVAQRHATLAARVLRELPFVKPVDDRGLRRVDLAFDVNEHNKLDAAQVAELVSMIEAHDFVALVSSVHAHAMPRNIDKAIGVVAAVRNVLGLDIEADKDAWLFVGDSGNDAAAFAYFPMSAGPSNVAAALPKLPVPPRFVARADRGRGFAEITATLLERRR